MRNNQIELSLFICFKAIYEQLNLTKAAEKLNISKASMSKNLMTLEDQLGGKLFIRSTRKISPTKEAEELYEKVDQIVSTVEDIESIFKDSKTLKGNIRITAPQSICVAFLGKLIIEFQNLNPNISVEILSTDSVLDIIDESIDLSLRINPPKNSTLVGKKVGSYGLHLVATPAYLKKNPIKKLEDINKHRFMAIRSHLNDWKAELDSSFLSGQLVSNDSILVGQLIRSGVALGLRSSWDIKTDLSKNKLIEVLPSLARKHCGDVWLLSHPSKIRLARVQALNNFLHSKLKSYFN